MRFAADPLVLGPVMAAVVLGGIGFPVLHDVRRNPRRAARWSLHTKVTLLGTGLLLFGGTAAVLAYEWGNPATLGPLGPAAIPTCLHRGREGDGTVQRVVQHGKGHLLDARGAACVATQDARLAHPLDALDELGRHGQRNDGGRPDVTDGRRRGREQALGVGEGVGCAEAEQHRGQAQALEEGTDEAAKTDRAEKSDAASPLGKLHVRQRKDDRVARFHAHEDMQNDAAHDDEGSERRVEAQATGPRRIGAPSDDREHHDGEHEGQQDGIRRRGDGNGHRRRPHPPRTGVDDATAMAGGRGHPRRRAAYPPPTAATPSTPTPAMMPGRLLLPELFFSGTARPGTLPDVEMLG